MTTAKNYSIHLERKEDYRQVENLVRESFWNVYRPGCFEHYVLHKLRDDPSFIRELDFVLEKDGRIIGQNVFVKAMIKNDNGRDIPVLTMGPLSIANNMKRQGYGKVLLDYSLAKAQELGYGAVLIEGNIQFYEKSGFQYASSYGLRYHGLSKDDDASFFLCRELIPGYLENIHGEYKTPSAYDINEKTCAEFDRHFPKKRKLKLPGQFL